MTAGFNWTTEAKGYLQSLWMEGKSARDIATAFGLRFACAPPTRNAVLGTAHRMGLPKRASPIRPNPERQAAAKRVVDRSAVKSGPGLMDLSSCMCRWPHGHPNRPATFHFCGATVARPGLSYCADHMARAYRPAGSRDTAAEIIAEALGEIENKSKPMTKAQRLARAEHALRIYGQGRAA